MSPVRPTVTVVGRRLAPEDHRLRDFLTRIAQPFEWVEAEVDEPDLPRLTEADGTVVAPATVERLAELWRMSVAPREREYDLAIVGAGPAGLAAAVYAASDGLKTLVLEHDVPGGQTSHTSLIENFFGFPEGIGGAELARLAGRQAERFGAELLIMRGVTGSSRGPDGPFTLEVAGGHEIDARAVIAAPGMVWRRLDVDGVEELLGRGVYYGAGRSEAAQCGGDPVVVVGAGNSAGQAVMHLGNAGAKVTMLVRGDRLGKSMSAYLVDRIESHPLIDVRFGTEVARVEADDAGKLSCVRTTAGDAIDARALFLCLGGTPRTGWATDVGVRLDPAGFILTGPDLLDAGRRPDDWPLARDPLALETSVPGLFAAGDVRHGSTKRVAGAVGDGAMATALVHRRLDELFAT
ncbi:MAG: NAD(P)/FAD-dependent oxidoreductase, partial [Actinomycetota bacterium]|nr:NAD(P)/FAD-dependent oxidoreductase [Actinomycetota bacterium]